MKKSGALRLAGLGRRGVLARRLRLFHYLPLVASMNNYVWMTKRAWGKDTCVLFYIHTRTHAHSYTASQEGRQVNVYRKRQADVLIHFVFTISRCKNFKKP